MKLNRAEIASIIITIIFIFAVIVISLWKGSPNAAVSVTFQNAETTAQPSPSPSNNEYAVESSPSPLVNLNTATAQELCSLPGIGEVLAQRIIEYRDENGLFTSVDEVMSVSGISSAKYEDIKSLITVKNIKQEAGQ